MRAVLRTLAECHAQHILHRDIKPGNFMLLTEAEDAPLKAIGKGNRGHTIVAATCGISCGCSGSSKQLVSSSSVDVEWQICQRMLFVQETAGISDSLQETASIARKHCMQPLHGSGGNSSRHARLLVSELVSCRRARQ